MSEQITITKYISDDYEQIMEVWESSVSATHHFLKKEDFEFYKNIIPKNYLSYLDLYVICLSEKIVGFMGSSGKNLEMLFVSGEQRGKGYGKMLLEYAIKNFDVKTVEVNEENMQALGFYKKLGFKVISRLDKDSENKDYPILKLER